MLIRKIEQIRRRGGADRIRESLVRADGNRRDLQAPRLLGANLSGRRHQRSHGRYRGNTESQCQKSAHGNLQAKFHLSPSLTVIGAIGRKTSSAVCRRRTVEIPFTKERRRSRENSFRFFP